MSEIKNQTPAQQSKRTVKIFALASFFNDFGSDMIYPIWPLFVTTVLHANMAVLGLLDGLGEAIVSLSQAGSGYWSDRIRKRKIFIWVGYLLGALSRVGYAGSTHWLQLLPFRVLDRAGKIRAAPRDAMVADLSTKEDRGGNFGLLRTMDNLGAVGGILVCVFFLGWLGYRKLFLLAAIPSLVGVFLILFAIKEAPIISVKAYRRISLKDLDKPYWSFLILSGIFALGNFSYSFLLIYSQKLGFAVTAIPILYLVFTLSASIFSLPFGRLSDKIGRKSMMMASFVLWGLVVLIFLKTHQHGLIVLAFILYGMHKGALDTVQKAFVAELAPVEYRATCLGLFQVVIGCSALPSSLLAGFLWDWIDPRVPFFVSLCLTATAAFLLNFIDEK